MQVGERKLEHQREEQEEVEQRKEEVEVGEMDRLWEVEEEGELLERALEQEVLELDHLRGEMEQLANYFQTYLLPHSLSVSEERG